MKELFNAFDFSQQDITRWYAASDDEEENVKEILVEVVDLLRKNNECQRKILDILAKLNSGLKPTRLNIIDDIEIVDFKI